MTTFRLLTASFLFTLAACTAEKGSTPREDETLSPASEPPDASVAHVSETPSDQPEPTASEAGVPLAVDASFGGDAPVVAVATPDAGKSETTEDAGPLVVDEPGVAPSFQRGFNFGNRLDAPNEGEWGPKIRESDFETLAERGFDHVRLPVRFSAHADDTEPYTIDEDLLSRVDWAIEQALTQDLSLVLDFQYYDALMSEPDVHSQRFVALWAQIAERYQVLPPHVAFELLSEPNGALEATYNELVAQTLEVIRASNPERKVIVDSFDYARSPTLPDLRLPDDPNVVASVHLYTPEAFTFQGAAWADPKFGTIGVVFPGPPEEPIVPVEAALNDAVTSQWFEDYNTLPEAENPSGPSAIEAVITALVEFRAETGRDVYVGEFGAVNSGPEDSRFRFVELIRSRCEAEDIGWAVWDNNGSDMAVLGTEEGAFADSIIDALIP
jgi:endoglucanase